MNFSSLGNVLNAGFEQVFNLYSPIVYKTGDILDTFVYRIGLQNSQYGVATAVGLFKSDVSFLFIVTGYRLAPSCRLSYFFSRGASILAFLSNVERPNI